MAGKSKNLVGQRFGHLTVLEKTPERFCGYVVWRCRCDCGRETLANTKYLQRGTATDCGCILKNAPRGRNTAADLTGQQFGHLTVESRAENRRRNMYWNCRCDCGNTKIVSLYSLKSGKTTSCGCENLWMHHMKDDLAGQRFGRLVALAPTKEKSKKSSVYWHCRCDCGKEVEVTRDALLSGVQKSCGCLRREVQDGIRNRLTRVDGTCIEWLEKRKYRSDNTSGFRGVNKTERGSYRVNIGFKGSRFYLGKYKNFDEAVRARLEAEEMIYGGFVKSYRLWSEKAQADVEWAQQNPLVFEVVKEKDGLRVITSVSENE
ncbi:transcriptional regulator [Marvinbryantia formatexigens DSM 14469]|nr:transcriptional regulator [Marvinbryantia formatexigens]UWO26080.1 transcriptional regulator [Marvinbryantia formatexigens DSM 14469]SDF90255.1 hypothetical protein SAMN05660368_01532 [Marvinbryantia formatexigens]